MSRHATRTNRNTLLRRLTKRLLYRFGEEADRARTRPYLRYFDTIRSRNTQQKEWCPAQIQVPSARKVIHYLFNWTRGYALLKFGVIHVGLGSR